MVTPRTTWRAFQRVRLTALLHDLMKEGKLEAA